MANKTQTIDLTPTWTAITPVLLELIIHGSPRGRQNAKEELMKMAKLADQWAKHVKSQQP